MEEKETINVDVNDVIDKHPFKAKIKKHLLAHKIERFICDFELIIITTLYVLLSLLIKGPFGPYNLNGWAFWWILYLAFPIIPQLFSVIRYKNINLFPIGIITLVIYLNLGLLYGLWHPYWALFFIIPVFHYIIAKINLNRHDRKE